MHPTKVHGEGKQPDGPYFAPQHEDDLSSQRLRQGMGYLGLLLPVLVYGLARWRAEGEPSGPGPLDSISAYYYSGAAAVFLGTLGALSAFLFTYRGYANDRGRWDVRTGRAASIAAALVALFPTDARPDFARPLWWGGWMGIIHFTAAAVLFGCFAVYSLVLFPETGGTPPDTDKRRRTAIYRVCGIGIVGALVWALLAHLTGHAIFVPESVALVLFGLSWLTKGKADWTARALVHRIRTGEPPQVSPAGG